LRGNCENSAFLWISGLALAHYACNLHAQE
jgi:hypothetical protein